jgi:O-antigen/teichoic acid export membrane protein
MPSAIGHKILRNTAWNFFSRLIHIPISICLIPFIINQVGAERYGVWVMLFALVDYFSLLDLGIGAATIKYVADYYALQNIRKIGHVILNTCVFNLVFIPPLAASLIFADEILTFFSIAPQNIAEAKFIFDCILLIFALSQFSSVFRNTLIGLQRIHVSNFFEIVYVLVYAAATWIVLGSGSGLKGLAVTLFCLRCGLAFAQMLCLLKAIPGCVRGLGTIDLEMGKEFIRYGFKLQLTSLAGLLNFQLDKLLIGHFLKMEFVTFYELGSKIAVMVRMLPSVLMSPLIPASAELSVLNDTERLEELYLRSTRYITLIAAPMAAFLVAMGPAIMKLWLGNQTQASAVAALQLLAIGYFFNIITGAVSSIGRGIGVLKYEMQTSALLTALNLVLSVIMIVQMGFIGALIGTGAAMTIGNLFYLVRFNGFMRTPLSRLLSQVLVKPVGAAVLAGCSVYGLHVLLSDVISFSALSRLELGSYLGGAGITFMSIFSTAIFMMKFLTRTDVELVGHLWAAVRSV